MKKLMHDVFLGEPAGVEDHGFTPSVICTHAYQAVPDPADLVTDLELGDPLNAEAVVGKAEALLPAGDGGHGADHNRNESHYMNGSDSQRRDRQRDAPADVASRISAPAVGSS